MFSDKKSTTISEPGTGQNRINEGTTFKGDIVSKGFFRIDGTVEGTINTPSKVVLGRTGIIKGSLNCQDADIEGKFDGNLDVSGTLSLKSTANIEGEVEVGKLAVEPGAIFNASCRMKGNVKKVSKDTKDVETTKAHPFDRAQRAQKTKAEQQAE